MAANELTFNQVSTLLAEITSQATGQKAVAPVDTASFVTLAQTALLSGYDNVINSISQVLSKTVFSIRPYNRKFSGLFMDSVKWGNHVRKLSPVDSAARNDERLPLVDGQSVDQQRVCKPGVLQTNFYGANVYERCITIFKDQLDVAFTSPEEFGRFISMVLQNVSDTIEQDHEVLARSALTNFMGGKIYQNIDVVHLLTEYNAYSGGSYTAQTIRSVDVYPVFARWAYARIKTVSDLMTERSNKYHTNIDGKPVMRHTPKAMQKLYLLGGEVYNIEANALSVTFRDDFARGLDYETVNFWQNINAPATINVTPSVMDNTGAIITADAVNETNVFGVLFDEEAVGITTVNTWSANAPFNASGGYTNTFWHFTDRYFNDYTENGVVFLMD